MNDDGGDGDAGGGGKIQLSYVNRREILLFLFNCERKREDGKSFHFLIFHHFVSVYAHVCVYVSEKTHVSHLYNQLLFSSFVMHKQRNCDIFFPVSSQILCDSTQSTNKIYFPIIITSTRNTLYLQINPNYRIRIFQFERVVRIFKKSVACKFQAVHFSLSNSNTFLQKSSPSREKINKEKNKFHTLNRKIIKNIEWGEGGWWLDSKKYQKTKRE